MVLRPAGSPTTASLLGRYGAELARIVDGGPAELALPHGRQLQKLDALMRNVVQQSFDGILSVRPTVAARPLTMPPRRSSADGRPSWSAAPCCSWSPSSRATARCSGATHAGR
jgi:hypothetical protein